MRISGSASPRWPRRHPVVTQVRGPGLFVGVELDCEATGRTDIGRVVANGLRRRGVLVGATGPARQRDQDPPAARLLGAARRPRRRGTRRDARRRSCDDRPMIDTATSSPTRHEPSWPTCSGSSAPAASSCSRGGRSGSSASTPASCRTSCPRPPRSARTTGASPRRPDEIADRRVEITGPVDRKMVINALNSGARVFMADFEDSNSPTWVNCIDGQRNLTDALDRTISLDTGEKQYTLARRSGGAVRAAARLAPRGAPLRGRRRADVGVAVRLRPLLLPQPRPQRPLLLPAEARVAPRGAALERRLRLVAGAARRAAGDDQGDRPDRDDPGGVRDGRDPATSCASTRPASTPAAGTTSSA